MTLALLVVAALCEAGLARRSLRTALDAKLAQDDLQRRWAATSCRDYVLERAEPLFIQLEDAEENRRSGWPAPSTVSVSSSLGGFAVELTIADEDAKLNLNSVYARKPTELAAVLMDFSGGSPAPVLRPDVSREAKLRKRVFASWGHVFDVAAVLAADEGSRQLGRLSRELSLWGNGKPNIRRAGDRVVEHTAAAAVSPAVAKKLLEGRRAFEGDLLLADLVESLELKRTEAIKLRSALSDSSSCYSLWLTLGKGRQRWYHLWITGDGARGGGPSVQSFSWQ